MRGEVGLLSNPGEGPGNAWRQCKALDDVSEPSRQPDQIRGLKFVRQEPIGRYTSDFVCREKKLVVEVDGGQHAESKSDAVRDRYLRENGYRVIRFWNNDVLSNLNGVLESLVAELDIPTDP
jgi:very-short-patch-repair endonuclease